MQGSRGLLLFLVAGALVLAGCTADDKVDPTGDDDTGTMPGDDPGDGEVDEVRAGMVPPVWAVGEYWSYQTTDGSAFDLVVAADTDDTWTLETSDPEMAWFHHRSEVSYLDAIQKEDLSGSQDGEPVRYFDFPLEEGKNWTTRWDGVDREVRVTGVGETFTFEAYEGDRLAVTYAYDPAIGWFTEMMFQAGDGVAWGLTLDDHGTNYTGEVVRWDASAYLLASGMGGSTGMGGHKEVAEGTGEVWISYTYDCDGAIAMHALLVVPVGDGAAYTPHGDCTTAQETHVIADPAPGLWVMYWQHAAFETADPTASPATFDVEIWGRTLVSEPVGG